MKNIIVKVNNATQTIAEHQVVTKDGQPTVVQATNKVNYELVDQATGYAPNHIVTKRVGKDLHVSMEESGKDSDLIIEGYYDEADSALIGMAEDGNYYYYVPDSGQVVDYVTELAPGDIEGQALGGEAYITPWWVGASDSGFGALPWLVGLAGLGVVGAVLASSSDNDDSKNGNATIKKELTINNLNLDVEANTPELKGELTDGQNLSSGTVKVIDPTTGKPLVLSNGETVQAVAGSDGKFTIILSDEAIQELGLDNDKGAKLIVQASSPEFPNQPKADVDLLPKAIILPKSDGSVEVTLDQDATKASVEFNNDAGEIKTVDIFKNTTTGQWEPKEGSPLPTGVTVEPSTGTVSISNAAVADNSEVKATQTKDDSSSFQNTAIAPDLAPEKPTISFDKEVGEVQITPPSDNDVTEMKVTYKNDNEESKEVIFTKDSNTGEWIDNDPEDGVGINPQTGVVSIPTDSVFDASDISVVAKDKNNSVMTEGELPKPQAPAVIPKTDGSVLVAPKSDDAIKQTISYFDQMTGEPVTIIVEKDENDEWVGRPDQTYPEGVNAGNNELPEGVSIDPETGVVTIPAGNVQDGSKVTATETDKLGTSDPKHTTAGDNIPEPKVESQLNGSVTVTPDSDATETSVTYRDEEGQLQDISFTKDPATGGWVDDNPNDNVTVDPKTGIVILSSDQVADGSTVSATQTTSKGTSGEGVADAKDDVAEPEVVASTDGSVTVIPSDDADTLDITYTDELTGEEVTVAFTKAAITGQWVDNNSNDDISIDETTGEVTLPSDTVSDNTPVKATQTENRDGTSVSSDVAQDTASTNISAPTVIGQPDGSITTEPSKKATEQVIDYTDEDGVQHEVSFTKDPDTGKWIDNNPNDDVTIDEDTGLVTVPEASVKDGSTVTATQTTPAGSSKPDDATAKDSIPEPEVTGQDDGSVSIKPDEGAIEQTISYTDEQGNTKEVTFTKAPNTGEWVDLNPNDNIEINPTTGEVTLPANVVKDGSEVGATQTIDVDGTPVSSDKETTKAPTVDTKAPEVPTITSNEKDGSVAVKPPTDVDTKTVEVKFVDESGNPQTVVATKGDNGTWSVPDTAPKGVDVNPATGVITIPEDALKDGSTVTATATDPAGNDSTPATATAPDNADITGPSAPSLTPSSTDGSVEVGLPTDAETGDTVIVKGTDEAGNPVEATLTKQADGTWTSDNTAVVPSTDAANPNTTTIPEDALKDGSTVTATATDPAGNDSTPATATAPDNADITAPTVIVTIGSAPVSTDDNPELTLDNGVSETLTFTFSEAVTDFESSDIEVSGGSIEELISNTDNTVYTAKFTPDKVGIATISVANGKFKDIAGNVNTDGAEPNNKVQIKVDPLLSIDIITIAGESQKPIDKDSDNYAIISASDNTNGIVVSGVTNDISDGTTVTVTLTDNEDASNVVTVETTVSDNSWQTNPTTIPNYSEFKTYSVEAKVVQDGVELIDTDTTTTPPIVSIEVTGNKESIDGLPATQENESGDGEYLSYTVNLKDANGDPTTSDTPTIITVNLGGQATSGVDYKLSEYYTNNPDANVKVVSESKIEITVPAGQSSSSFIVDPIFEDTTSISEYGAEPNEYVEATIINIDSTSAIVPIINNQINADAIAGTTNTHDVATGIIINSNPVSIAQLTGDYSLVVGPNVNDVGATAFNADQLMQSEGGILTTDYDDIVYIGFKQDQTPDGYGNISNAGATNNGRLTDGNNSRTTIDLAGGDDILKIKGITDSLSLVYLGEGNDTFLVGSGLRYGSTFAEEGNDTIDVTGNVRNNGVYAGSGSDNIIVSGYISAKIDLGSGRAMPSDYLTTYQDGSGMSLGSDSLNADTVDDLNTLNVTGDIDGGIVYGGIGQDKITARYVESGATLDLGAGKDTLKADGLNNSSKVNMGSGDDTVDLGYMGSGTYTPELLLGLGSDTLVLTTLNKGNIDTGADTDVDTINITTMQGGVVNLGVNDTIRVTNLAGGKVNLAQSDDTFSIGNYTGGQINFGEGVDTLNVKGNLSLSDVTNVEYINMANNDNNTLSNVYVNTLNTNADGLYIYGNSGDKVNIGRQENSRPLQEEYYDSDSWKDSGADVVGADGLSYSVWKYAGDTGTAEVYIHDNVSVI